MQYNYHVGDVVAWAVRHVEQGLPLFHAMICDPPYHLTSITKRFSKPNAAPAKSKQTGAFRRLSRGFMGQAWDGGDLTFQPETWQALSRVLYPGGWLAVFAGSRGWHRVAYAMESAGLIIHPTIFMMGWASADRMSKKSRIDSQLSDENEAAIWANHAYGAGALKSSIEPIILAQVPYPSGVRTVDHIVATGAGALDLQGASVPNESSNKNRGPSNAIVCHTPQCTIDPLTGQHDCVEGCPAYWLTQQGKGRRSEKPSGGGRIQHPGGFWGNSKQYGTSQVYTDNGSPARFFMNVDYLYEMTEPPFYYCATAQTWEREAGVSGPVGVVKTMNELGPAPDNAKPNKSSGTVRRNLHPTVKPIEVTEWLARLFLPPDHYSPERRLVVPFAGVASEMIGAGLAGWDYVQGIEQSTKYAAIGWQRLEFWSEWYGLGYGEAKAQAKEILDMIADNEDNPIPDDGFSDTPLFAGLA